MDLPKQQASRADYLALDLASVGKHEFYRGEVFAMAGGSFRHAKVGLNISSHLSHVLRGSPCQPMNSDMRISTPSGLDTYPDVSAFCGDPELADNGHTLLNPVLIVEVLSPRTRSYDRGDKFMLYRAIPSLMDYVLVEPDDVLVEHYQRTGAYGWQLHEYRSLADVLPLKSVGQAISLAQCYEGLGL